MSYQKNIFFGREKDIEGLYEYLQLEKLIVLYSKSGLGKSSLLNAGVVPKIDREGKYEPILVRLGSYSKSHNKNDTPLSLTIARINAQQEYPSFFLDELLPKENSLWYHIKRRQLLEENCNAFVLVFDQFEELFTYPEAGVIAFKKQLAELLNTTIPQRYLEVVKHQMVGQEQILEADELSALHQPFKIKVILAIRSDRMHLLDNLSDYLPNVLTRRYRLGSLTIDQAEDAILNPAYLNQDTFVSKPFDYEDQAIEKILHYLTREDTQEIESFQLQILCQSLERKVINDGIKVIREEHIQDLESIYENYYENQISLIQNENERLAARRLIEEGLIFEIEKRRLTLYEGQINEVFGVGAELIKKLVDSHIIRAEPSLKGGYTYELSHDTLVEPVLKAKEKRIREERQKTDMQREEEERLQREARVRKLLEEKRKRQTRSVAIVTSVLSLISICLLVLFIFQIRKVNQAAALLAEEKQKAEDAKQIAETETEKASEALLEAQYQKKKAEEAQLAAQSEKENAVKNLKDLHFAKFDLMVKDAETYEIAGEFDLAIAKLKRSIEFSETNKLGQNPVNLANTKIRELEELKNKGLTGKDE